MPVELAQQRRLDAAALGRARAARMKAAARRQVELARDVALHLLAKLVRAVRVGRGRRGDQCLRVGVPGRGVQRVAMRQG